MKYPPVKIDPCIFYNYPHLFDILSKGKHMADMDDLRFRQIHLEANLP